MCDFKPGDEVAPIKGFEYHIETPDDPRNKVSLCDVFVVESVILHLGQVGVVLAGHHSSHSTGAFLAAAFRKVQKRDIGEWLKQAATYDEEQHAPAPTTPARKRERAS